jgi:acetyl esterase
MYNTELLEQSKMVSEELGAARSNLLKKISEDPSLQLTPQIRREMANKFFIKHGGPKTDMEKVEDFCISATDGYQIPVRRYYPKVSNNDFMFMYIHGGGWTQGNIETHDYLCRKIADIIHAEVISVDYRLAPEYIYPTHLNDVFSVYSWCANNLGKEIIISGDSAGGNLSTALFLKIRDENVKKPRALMLIYPPLSNDFESPSFELFKDIDALTKIGTIDYTVQYVGKSSYDELKTVKDKFIFPLLEEDVSTFPPTIIISGGCDVLLDASLELAKRLKAASVLVNHIIVDGAIHGFMSYGEDFNPQVTEVLNSVKTLLP